jgi:excisionase family DNA binding protein
MSDQLPDDLISTKAAGTLLGVSPWTIRRMVDAGRLHGYRVGRLVRVSRSEVLASVRPIEPKNSPDN